jgi:hypothetical protein
VTGHYIDAPPEKPQHWELKSDQLAFTPFEGRHTGNNMGDILVRTVDRYGIRKKVSGNTAGVLPQLKLLYSNCSGWMVHSRQCAEQLCRTQEIW